MQCAYQRKVSLRRYSHPTNPSQLQISNVGVLAEVLLLCAVKTQRMECGSLTGTLVTSIGLQAETKRARWAQSTYSQVSAQKNFALARTTTCNGAGIVMIVGQGAVQSRTKAVTAYAIGARRMGHLAVCSS